MISQGRLDKANQFFAAAGNLRDLADEDDEVADAFITLNVHAGIAASDVICCCRLGEHAQGESHEDAVTLLATTDKDAAKHLRTLLRLKTRAGYGHTPATTDEIKKAARAAEALMEKARQIHRRTPARR